MQALTMKSAGELVGTSKSTIYRMVKEGKISSSKDDDGTVKIDPAELARAFPDFVPGEQPKPIETSTTAEMEMLRFQLKVAQEKIADQNVRIADITVERDSWREEAKDWKQTSSNNQVLLLEYETKEEPKRAGLLSAIFGR